MLPRNLGPVTEPLGFSTRAIHAGPDADPAYGAVTPPIYATSTYKQDGVGGTKGGYEYSRSANPTRTVLEECLASLEGGRHGLAFASGLAAEDAVLRAFTGPDGHAVVPHDAYGGTYRLFARVYDPWGLRCTPVDLTDLGAVEAAIEPEQTTVVWVETPTNPLLSVVDIAGVAERAHAAGALLVVDNTFASPYLQQPLALGADIVVHSTTKYIGGHSDVVGGALVLDDEQLAERLRFHQNAMGGIAGPFDAWLTLRGLRTLSVRMERHCDNAERVAAFLAEHPAVTEVIYPGLASHPGHDLAQRQMRRFGGMVSFRVAGGEQQALEVCGRTKIIILGESLGGVESLIEHPGRMTHASVAGTPLEVPSDLVRVSVGIEDVDDLVADLEQALAG
jgi:cystathionine gamma-synthase